MANLICVRLNKGDCPSWGFRLQGGKDFGTPLVVQKVIGGSPAERAGLIAGDTVIKINNTEVYNLRHKDAQDVILRAGNSFDVAIQRSGSTWKPSVAPVGSISSPRPAAPINNISPVTNTSLAAGRQDSIGAIGTSHNVSAKPFNQLNGGPKLVNKQYNSPIPIYSEQSIAETLSAQTEVLANGVLGVNFKKNEKSYNAANSEVFRMVQEADKEPRDYEPVNRSDFYATHSHAIGGHSAAARTTPTTGDQYQSINQEGTDSQQSEPDEKSACTVNQQITKCSDCESVIVGVFVRIKDKNLHVECFKCSTCGSSLKNVGYYNLNNKLYCDVHAKLAARNNPPAPNLQPITVPPGGKIPTSAISAALSSHSLPSPSSLSPNTNYSAAPYQPGSNYSAPKPFCSVNAPLSPSSHTPKLSPTTTPYTGRSGVKSGAPYRDTRCIQNIVWPPASSEPDFPTASPLYFPPPSQVQEHQKLLLDTEIRSKKNNIETESKEEEEEMSFINQFTQDRNMSLCSSEVFNITGRRSATECTEAISDTIDRQILVESIVKSRPKSPPPIVTPQTRPGDVDVSFIISEAEFKQGAYSNINIAETTETKTCLKETQQQSLASMYEKKIKVENTIPHKWESSMVTALTVAPDKPYVNFSEESSSQRDSFSEIPAKTSNTALAAALAVAPAVPFTPSSVLTLAPVSLPEETVPYFPPEHPIIPDLKPSTEEQKTEKSVKTKVYGKKKTEEKDTLFQDLPTPPTERISMLAALTTAPDRPYSPFSSGVATTTSTTDEKECSLEMHTKTDVERTKPEIKKLQDYSFYAHSSKPILKTYAPFPSAFIQTTEVSDTSVALSNIKENADIKEESTKSIEDHVSEKLEVSKNVHSSENVTNICTGLPPMIQVVRSTFETNTDKVQMEMSCQFLGDGIPQRQIVEKHSTDVSEHKLVEQRNSEKHSEMCQTKSDQILKEKEKAQSHVVALTTKQELSEPISYESQAAVSTFESEKSDVSRAEANRFQLKSRKELPYLSCEARSGVTESLMLKKAVSSFESEKSNVSKTENIHTANTYHLKPSKEPLTILKPGEVNLNVPKISFQPVDDSTRSTTTFSPRPRSLTPSMINKPAPALPYYQSNLVATECAAIQTSIFDPTSPAISRSPTPCTLRPSSPFITPSASTRPISPAQGPPENPLQSHKSIYEIKREGKVQNARNHLQSYIPEHQYRVQQNTLSEYCREETPKVIQTLSETGGKSITVKQNTKKAELCEVSKLESRSLQCTREGNAQIQRKSHVTEEYEHQQKSKLVQIETVSDHTKILESQAKSTALSDSQAMIGFHVTNPQPLRSPFFNSDGMSNTVTSTETHSKIPKRVPHSDASVKACPTVTATASSIPVANTCPKRNITKPNVSQPNVGTGGGRQAGAIGVAPKRGRGVLNLAATPGSRVPLCAQCNTNIRGPFITALGKIWCPDHFICATPSCRRPLHDLGFVEENGQLYCEYCFEQYLAPPCSKCNAKIKGDCLKAIGRNFHPECFNCVYCGKLFGNSPFFLEDAQPYCEADWNELFTTKCFACGFPVEAGDRWVEALNNNYHSQCFNCTMCKKNLEGQSFFAKGGRPFCKNHAR